MTNTVVTRNGLEVVVQPAGDLVAALLPELRSALREAIADGIREMIVDFSNVRMVDSSGLGLLISAHNSMRKAGGRVAVTHASQEIVELFKSMRIHQHLSVSEECAEEQ